MSDLTILYVTSNTISDTFGTNLRRYLLSASSKQVAGIISVSKKPLDFGTNFVMRGNRSHIGIYRDALFGAKQIRTKYMAFCEDDVLYSPVHFKYRPKKRAFAYNSNCWSLYTWIRPALFSYKGVRRNNCTLICETALYIETMEERFAFYKDTPVDQIPLRHWAEPGRYEGNIGLTIRETELFNPQPPNIMFSHPEGLSMNNLGYRKAMGDVRAEKIPYWGEAEDILKLYEKPI